MTALVGASVDRHWESVLHSPTTDKMKHEHDERHDKNDVDESPGDVKTESESPKDDENDGDGWEHI